MKQDRQNLSMRIVQYLFEMFLIHPRRTLRNIEMLPFYMRDLSELMMQQDKSSIYFPLGKPNPFFRDRFSDIGTTKGHYFHQDLLVAQRIYINNPIRHIDVGSRIDGFIAHVASFRKIEVMDIRKLQSNLHNITFIQSDLMHDVDPSFIDCCDSISCLHALEHFGLGRYGDPIDFDGHIKGFFNILKILKKNGKMYLSVPIGPQRIEFNAHRVFSVKYLMEIINDFLIIDSFSYVDDRGDLIKNTQLDKQQIEDSLGCHYGCGIFEMTKR